MIDNKTKDFRIEGSLVRDTELKNFIHSYVEKGNNIVTDWW